MPKKPNGWATAAKAAALLTPPWNVFWWTVSSVAHAVQEKTSKKDEHAEKPDESILKRIVMAPIELPLRPITFVKEKIDQFVRDAKTAEHRAAGEWIAGRLRSHGISVRGVSSSPSGISVDVDLRPDQESAYGQVYSQAVHYFRGIGISADDICGDAARPRLLDRHWADANDITSCAVEVCSAPCVDCRSIGSKGWHFGARAEFIRDRLSVMRYRIELQNGKVREFNGHICHSCLAKTKYVSMTCSAI